MKLALLPIESGIIGPSTAWPVILAQSPLDHGALHS